MAGFKHIALLAAMIFAANISAYAQMRVVSREALDSINNPALSSSARFVKFESPVINAGRLDEDGGIKTYEYVGRNVSSDKVLNIGRITTTCTCALASVNTHEVKPGSTFKVTLRYDPKGHPGRFERKVYIYGYAGDSSGEVVGDHSEVEQNRLMAVLKLNVEVEVGADLSRTWPVELGNVRLKRSEARFVEGEKSVVSLRLINVSDRPVTLVPEAMFLPKCLSVEPSRLVLKPQEVKMLDIVYDGTVLGTVTGKVGTVTSKENGTVEAKLMLRGAGVPPSQSVIRIFIDK